MARPAAPGRARRTMRRALYFQIAANLLLVIVCLILSMRQGAWRTLLTQGRLTWPLLLAMLAVVTCSMVLYIYVRDIARTIFDLENAVDVLQTAVGRDGGFETARNGDHQSLTDLLQILLQREATAQLMTKQAEINALQNQINPHFLYNTLETIRGQALCRGASDIADTTKALADIFRYNISKKGAMIYLSEELSNIDSYIKIQQIRFNDKFELTLRIDEDTRNILIPKLLVQPVIENALKHGLETKSGKGHITLHTYRTPQKLVISVADNGVGMPPDKLVALNEKLAAGGSAWMSTVQKENIGLENINERIKLIYGEDYGITVISAQDVGTKVTLSLGITSQQLPDA